MTRFLWHEALTSLATVLADAGAGDEFDFDDGYASHRAAAQILEAAGRVGTFYLVTRWVGLPGFLTWDDVRRLLEHGHRIGNHTASHVWLGRVPWEARLLELREAQNAILAATGRAPTLFAYPYGRIDPGARAAVARFGFEVARGIAEVEART